MPLKRCNKSGQSGWKWGDQGTCYVYNPDSKQSETIARKKAISQGVAIGEYFREAIEKIWKFRNKH